MDHHEREEWKHAACKAQATGTHFQTKFIGFLFLHVTLKISQQQLVCQYNIDHYFEAVNFVLKIFSHTYAGYFHCVSHPQTKLET